MICILHRNSKTSQMEDYVFHSEELHHENPLFEMWLWNIMSESVKRNSKFHTRKNSNKRIHWNSHGKFLHLLFEMWLWDIMSESEKRFDEILIFSTGDLYYA